jgi:DNA-binding CsgD family transcriptional regulator
MSKHRTRWTDDEKDTLRSLTREGHTYARIAEMIGRTEHAINIMAYHLDHKHPRIKTWTAAELARAKRLYDAGNTTQEIARILHRTPTGVQSMMTAHGLLDTSRRGCSKRKSDTQVYVLRRRGLMIREILLVLGRDDSEGARKATRMWLEAYCARLGVDVPSASTPRKKPDMQLVEQIRAEIASLTGSMGKYTTSIANQGRPARGAA